MQRLLAALDDAAAAGGTEVSVPVVLIGALRDRLEQAATFAAFATDVVVHGNERCEISWISDSVTDSFGWRPSDLIGRSFVSLVHRDDQHIVREVTDNLRVGEVLTYTVRFRTSTGEYRWIGLRVSWSVDADGTTIGWTGGWSDLTEELVSRRELAISRDRLRQVFETMFDPIAMLAPLRDTTGTVIDFIYTDANPAACNYNRVPHEDLVGMRLLDLFPRMRTSGIFDRCVEVIETGTPFIVDGFRYQNDRMGMERTYEMRIVRVGDELSYTWRDVTNRQDQMIRRVDEIVTAPIIDATTQLTAVLGTSSLVDRQRIIAALRQHELALRRLHSVVDEVRPTTVAHTDLGAMLRAMLFGATARSGAAGDLTIANGEGTLDDPLLEAHLLLVARLALDAMASACGATELNVALDCEDSVIELRIAATVASSNPDPVGLDDAVLCGRALGAFCAVTVHPFELGLVWRASLHAMDHGHP